MVNFVIGLVAIIVFFVPVGAALDEKGTGAAFLTGAFILSLYVLIALSVISN